MEEGGEGGERALTVPPPPSARRCGTAFYQGNLKHRGVDGTEVQSDYEGVDDPDEEEEEEEGGSGDAAGKEERPGGRDGEEDEDEDSLQSAGALAASAIQGHGRSLTPPLVQSAPRYGTTYSPGARV